MFIVGVGISYIKFDFVSPSYQGFIIDSHTNYFILLAKGEKLYSYLKDNKLEIGDYIKITGNKKKLDFVSIESQFNFQEYLEQKGIYYELEIKDIEIKFSNPIRIKERREKFLSHFDEDKQNFISALMFSDKSNNDVAGDINKLHLARLINVSGIFIYAYLHFFAFILAYFIKNKRVKIVSLITLLPYLIFTFPRFAVIRIFILEIFRYINEAFLNKKFKSIELTGIVGTIFILIDHHLAYQMSFIFGFTIPVMMIFINDAVHKWKRWKKRIVSTLLLYVLLIPFELKFYNGVNPLSMITQTLLAPFFIFIGVISLLCFYGVPLYGLVNLSIGGLTNLLGWLSKAAFQINAPPMEGWIILIYVIVFMAYCYYRSIDFIPLYKAVMMIMVFGLSLYLSPTINLVTEEVSFINVGQGDSCLIRKGKTSILIDTGGLSYIDVAKESLIPYLQKQRIYRLDMVITTHNDFDHNGALDSLKENFYVKNVVTEATYFPLKVGSITFNNYNNHIASYKEENNSSLVIGFKLLNKHFLIMGDAPIEVERNIMKEYEHLDCDILKVGHHGSKTSTSDEFVKYLSPEKAIISCGKNNRYGHPHNIVIQTLKNNNVEILRTDEMGTISFRGFLT